jgi:hypothetical protein
MASYAVSSTTNVTGHSFELDVKGCALAGCHTSYSLESLEEKILDLQEKETNKITALVSLLNQWATNKAPALLGATDYNKSKQNSWEFPTIGSLATITNAGPVNTNQIKLPSAILKARFNLYMVAYDSSLGVHNPSYVDYLLADAQTNVMSQMLDLPSAFQANTVQGYAPLTVQFTNLNVTAAGGTWTFGDGGTTTGLNPSYVYNTPGTYAVTFAETGGTTMTRTNYIKVCARPVVSFTADVTTITNGQTVTFTNTTSNAGDVWRYRWYPQYNVNSGVRYDLTASEVFSYTYTNAAPTNLSVRVIAYTPLGSAATNTTSNFITVQ